MFFGQVMHALGILVASTWLASSPPKVSEIPINQELYKFFDVQEQNDYQRLIQQSVNGDSQALQKLIKFDCGGASFCYWHGEVLAKLTYKMGEEQVIKLVSSLNSTDKTYFRHLLSAGLEYGSFTTDGTDTTRNLLIENEFPRLNQWLIKGGTLRD